MEQQCNGYYVLRSALEVVAAVEEPPLDELTLTLTLNVPLPPPFYLTTTWPTASGY